MLTCPFCEFENIDPQLSCAACGQPFQRLRVIDIPGPGAAAITPDDLYGSHYLDADQRYRLMDCPLDSADAKALTVIDCQPNSASPLQALQQIWLEIPTLDLASHPLTAGLPAEAHPYLALQVDNFPAIPELHHAWQTPQRALLLIEDRTTWLPLATAWSATDDPLQRIQWLLETTLLWQALAACQGQATLLNAQRLAVNRNQLLCLTQIDQVPGPSPLPLPALGQMWQQLMGPSPASLPSPLPTLVQVLTKGTGLTLEQVQDALALAAQDYQADSSPGLPLLRNGSESFTGMSDRPEADFPQAIAAPSPSVTLEPGDDQTLADLGLGYLDLDGLDFDVAFETQEFETQEFVEDDGTGLLEAPTMVLPMKLASLDDAGQSHVGQQRRHNEDWFFTQTQLHKVSGPQGTVLRAKGLYILCDGMGGHASGEVASQLAGQALRDYLAQHWGDRLPDQEILSQAVITANQTIFDINQTNATSGVGRMGTTLVMVLVHNLDMAVVHVGDSRLYGYSKRLGLRQLTLDHEVGQREINRGVDPALAYARPDAYQLTQALGPRRKEDLTPSIAYHEITEDTLLILCSDGLSDNYLLERHVDTHLAGLLSSKASLESGAAQLIDLANEKNGHDNITAILIRTKLQPDLSSLAKP